MPMGYVPYSSSGFEKSNATRREDMHHISKHSPYAAQLERSSKNRQGKSPVHISSSSHKPSCTSVQFNLSLQATV